MNLENRVVLVTGASRGIGAETAVRLAAHGAAVGVNYFRSEEPARAVVERILGAGGRAVAVAGDARDPAAFASMVGEVESAFGPLDTLVLNAAISFPMKPFLEFAWEEFERKLVDELRAAFVGCQTVAPGFVERGRGCIVAISSQLSRVPGFGFCAHSTAKSGLDAFARALALELGPHGIRVNVVAPGLTETDATAQIPAEVKTATAGHTPLRRIGVPEDVAGVVHMVVSDAAGFVTGAYIPVGGGTHMP